MKDLLASNQVIQRANQLLSEVKNTMTLAQIKEFEDIDQLRIESMKEAEKHCRKLKMGEISWSPKLQAVRNKIMYLSLSRRRKLNRKVSANNLQRLSKKTDVNASELTVKEMDGKIDEAYKQYREIKKNHRNHRDDFLNELADALQKQGKGNKANTVRRLLALENQRAMFRRLAAVYNKTADLSTKSISIQSEEGEKIVTNKEEMEEAIINKNRAKYHQTESSCPFQSKPLKDHFGNMGKGPFTEDALLGNYRSPNDITEQTKDYIELCRLPQAELIVNPLTRNLDYFCDSWKKMREQTSSRDTHFGHYKSALECNEIMTMHYQLAEIPFPKGYSP